MDYCTDLGYDLAVINDQETWDHVKNFITDNKITTAVWIGLYWDQMKFKWVNGGDITSSTAWGTGEPDCVERVPLEAHCGNVIQNCVLIQDYVWMTTSCSESNGGLCMGERPILNGTEQLSTTEIETTSLNKKPTTGATAKLTFVASSDSNEHTSSLITVPTTITGLQTVDWTIKTTVDILDGTYDFTTTTASAVTEMSTGKDQSTQSTFSITDAINSSVCVPVCSCRPNLTPSDLQSIVYKIDKKETGFYRRQLISAHDGRFSSRVIGWTGVIVLCSVIACVIFIDISRFCTKK